MNRALVTTFDGAHRLERPIELPLSQNGVDRPPAAHGTLSAEMRAYYVEKRRALITELNALNKLLGLTTK